VQVRKKREFVKIRKDELKQDEGAAASAQASPFFPLYLRVVRHDPVSIKATSCVLLLIGLFTCESNLAALNPYETLTPS